MVGISKTEVGDSLDLLLGLLTDIGFCQPDGSFITSLADLGQWLGEMARAGEAVCLDGLATRVQRPQGWVNQKVLYDAKRHSHTAQGLALSSVHGDLLWCDGGWPGSCHEQELVQLSGLGGVLDAAGVTLSSTAGSAAWQGRRWRGLLYRIRAVFRAAGAFGVPGPLATPRPRMNERHVQLLILLVARCCVDLVGWRPSHRSVVGVSSAIWHFPRRRVEGSRGSAGWCLPPGRDHRLPEGEKPVEGLTRLLQPTEYALPVDEEFGAGEGAECPVLGSSAHRLGSARPGSQWLWCLPQRRKFMRWARV
jgi:hypothetical protein